jgi:hypothetical protein
MLRPWLLVLRTCWDFRKMTPSQTTNPELLSSCYATAYERKSRPEQCAVAGLRAKPWILWGNTCLRLPPVDGTLSLILFPWCLVGR